MKLINMISWALLVLAMSCQSALGGISIKIYSASVDDVTETLYLKGSYFEAFGTPAVTIGDTILNNCNISSQEISCSLTGTPAMSGGTWTVNISAGNAPHANEEIDVFIPVGFTSAQCNPGDFVECYTGPPATLNVGECRSGVRQCLAGGNWSDCQNEILPTVEEICGDYKDDDCDGSLVTNGCCNVPLITSIYPSEVCQGETYFTAYIDNPNYIFLYTEVFIGLESVQWSPEVGGNLRVHLTLRVQPGVHDIVISNGDGCESVLASALTVVDCY